VCGPYLCMSRSLSIIGHVTPACVFSVYHDSLLLEAEFTPSDMYMLCRKQHHYMFTSTVTYQQLTSRDLTAATTSRTTTLDALN